MKWNSLDMQKPPDVAGVDKDAPLARSEATAEDGWTPPKISRIGAWLRFLRIKLARVILLPDYTFDEAFQLRETVRKDGRLTRGYILMSALSAGIAALGLLQSSTAVVIGAMLISPLMSPIAALGFGFASIDGRRIKDAARVVAIGAGIGILTGILITWLSPIRNATPEILARTQPTLLDLAIALFSGIAGGYATVIGKGGTAIGVAIATALMPPLAVLGYGIGVLQVRFALGALLLFLTNLAAITLAFAVVARIAGVARPLYKVEWTPRYVGAFAAVFLLLATPLSMTLIKLSREAQIRTAASNAILSVCGDESTIAQIDVTTPMFGEPSVDALVIAPGYTTNAAADAEKRMRAVLGREVQINLQQVMAADWQSRTRAMVDAAMERTTAGIAADVPPIDLVRQSIGLPTRSLWSDRAQRLVYVEPVPAPGWTLADYRSIEASARSGTDTKWTVRVVPPPMEQLTIALGDAANAPEGAVSPELGIWALRRWGMNKVTIEGAANPAYEPLVKALSDAGIEARFSRAAAPPSTAGGDGDASEAPTSATLAVFTPSPSQIAAANAAARREAEESAAREEAR
ncbi:DUF389 domain-containing protein [Novosphingobium aquimarinum]|uniref:DUF389 domain-containing protein n=1 Tax=Novosphingobium aquimarinum TaxID=2682494 RepID=UPI0012EB7556|nr:DUF389 domain-containing protein [Novosphingobium aquimarinum]